MPDVNERGIPYYTGWTPKSLRVGRKGGGSSSTAERNTKRSRLGNRLDRAIYKSAKGYKHPRYPALCRVANMINGARV